MEGSSTEVSDEGEGRAGANVGRKRVRKVDKWTRNVKRRQVVHGEAHAAASGRNIPAKTVGRPCTCRRKCFTKFNEESLNKFCQALYALENKNLQDAHLAGLISARKVGRRRARDGTRAPKSETYLYKVRCSIILRA